MFAKKKTLQVFPAFNEDRQAIANLIHFGAYVHRHLDWRPPLDWLGRHPFLVARRGNELVGVLVCPPDPPNIAWIRLFAVAHGVSPDQVWGEMWSDALPRLRGFSGSLSIAAIPLYRWFSNILEGSGFNRDHRVVVLSWEPGVRPDSSHPEALSIRPMTLEDIPAVEKVDAAAFGGVWQNSQSCLEIAFRQSALASVALMGEQLVGYQISTATQMGGHLARLAVLPEYQRSGIGYALVDNLLKEFEKRGARSVTVNTQHDNHISLALYQKAGFRLTGEEYPVYEYDLG